MLVLLAQATHGYRAHLACGVLREHGVEAHVFHEASDILHGGASTTTASLWVREDELEDARAILATPPLEPLPHEERLESMNIRRELLPPMEAVALGVAGVLFAAFAAVTVAALMPKLVGHGLSRGVEPAVESALALLPALLSQAVAALGIGLAVALVCAPLFQVIRLFRADSWIGIALFAILGITLALTFSMISMH